MSKGVSGKGMRFNSGKIELHQAPTSIQYALAAVFKYGESKYAKNNWREGMSWVAVYDCLQRHSLKWLDGEELDNESGLPHLYHMAANIAMLIEFSKTCPKLDDRFKGVKCDHVAMRLSNDHSPVLPGSGITEEDLNDMANEFDTQIRDLNNCSDDLTSLGEKDKEYLGTIRKCKGACNCS